MKKKSYPRQPKSDQSDILPKFLDVESRVFTVQGKDIYIGKEKIQPQIRSLLRDEAEVLKNTRLWEILNASVINEAYFLALDKSEDFKHVRFAKAMKHWSFFMMNVIHLLAKKE